MKIKSIVGTLAGGLAATLLSGVVAFGQSATAFPEKNITFLIPYGPGGGFDRMVRTLAPAMEKYLPNNVHVVPKNMPGSGGRKAIEAVYRAKADGYTIALMSFPGIAISPLIGEKVGYDLDKMTYLGRVSKDNYALAVAGNSAINSVADLKALDRPVKFTSSGFGGTSHATISVSAAVMETESVMITGYKGSKAAILGTVRGDGDATMSPTNSIRKFVKSGDIKLLMTTESVSSYPGVPTAIEAGYSELDGIGLSRITVGPPGMPDDIQKILAEALMKAMADPEVIAVAAKSKDVFAALSPEDTKTSVDNGLSFFEKYKAAIKK